MSACDSDSHNHPAYAHIHGGKSNSHTVLYECPECLSEYEKLVCETYAKSLLNLITDAPDKLIICDQCQRKVPVGFYVMDIIPVIYNVDQILANAFETLLPCESRSHNDPEYREWHTGSAGEFYIVSTCDNCTYAFTKLYCEGFTQWVIRDLHEYPDASVECPACQHNQTMRQWTKNITERSTGASIKFKS